MDFSVHRTFVVNMEARIDRKLHIEGQFAGRPEFEVTIVGAIEHPVGSYGLWQSLRFILAELIRGDEEYIIFCEDDHQFTNAYSASVFVECLKDAMELDADMVIGGSSGVKSPFGSRGRLIWADAYTGNQFIVIFNTLFRRILAAEFVVGDDMDLILSNLSKKKFIIFPFISVQKEFGYSDVTYRNASIGVVEGLFKSSMFVIDYMLKVQDKFNNRNETRRLLDTYESISVTTYILADDDDSESWEEFDIRPEFDVNVLFLNAIDGNGNQFEAVLREIVARGVHDEDSVVVLCTGHHGFTDFYERDTFMGSLILLNELGFDLVVGGGGGDFGHVLPLNNGIVWINEISDFTFLVIFNRFFEHILNTDFKIGESLAQFFSRIAASKALFHPFISETRINGRSLYVPVPTRLDKKSTAGELEEIRVAFNNFGRVKGSSGALLD